MSLSARLRCVVDRGRQMALCPPVLLGLVACALLFFARTRGAFDALSANTGVPGYDFFGLPRCGLALRQGASIASSWKDMPYGPYSTDWASHPMLCAALGAPLSFLPAWTAYWAFAFFLTCLQALGLVVAAHWAGLPGVWKEATPWVRAKIIALFFMCGTFFPQYVLLHQAQYHGLSMLFFLLVLRRSTQVLGFVGSALSKPLLAPAGLIVLAERNFRSVVKIVLLALAGTAPFYWFGQGAQKNLDGSGHTSSVFDVLGQSGWLKLKYSVMNWNQEMSLSKVFERFFDGETNFYLRVVIALVCLGSAFYALFRAREREIAITLAALSLMFLYARGHEYHAVTLLPALVFVGSRKGGPSLTLLIAVALLALPSTWSLLGPYRVEGEPFEINHMIEASSMLGWAFVLQKPLGLLALWIALLAGLRAHPPKE